MKRATTSEFFPSSPEEIEAVIAKAPQRVDDPEGAYDPNDPTAVEAFWKNATVHRPGRGQAGHR